MLNGLFRGVRFVRSTPRPQRPPEIIYLGYDNRDNVGSMHTALLNRLKGGGLDTL